MIQRCFALPYYVYCLRLRCLVSFLFYSTIFCVIRLYISHGLICRRPWQGGMPFEIRLVPLVVLAAVSVLQTA
ncbi:Uncharacterised protein [Neisseria animalis]|nr:Uncharacterised protein [Neisseria animalis]